MKPQHSPTLPAFTQHNPPPCVTHTHYPAPHGAGVLAWVCATTIGTVIALCCLAASWVGSVTIGGAS